MSEKSALYKLSLQPSIVPYWRPNGMSHITTSTSVNRGSVMHRKRLKRGRSKATDAQQIPVCFIVALYALHHRGLRQIFSGHQRISESCIALKLHNFAGSATKSQHSRGRLGRLRSTSLVPLLWEADADSCHQFPRSHSNNRSSNAGDNYPSSIAADHSREA